MPSLSTMVTVPLWLPDTGGLKVTLMEQLAKPETPEPQLFVWVKTPLLVTEPTFKNEAPVFVSLSERVLLVPTEILPKFREEGERPTDVPLPDSLIVCGLPRSLVSITKLPSRRPGWVGANVTVNVQLPAGPSVLPQLLD
jgi:hypothetical protein